MSGNNLPPDPPRSQADSAQGSKRTSNPAPPARHVQDSLREQLQQLQCSYDDSQRQVAELRAQVASLQLDKQQTQKVHDLTVLKLHDAAEEVRKTVERQSSAFQAIEAQRNTVFEPARDAEAAAKAEGPALTKARNEDEETAEAGEHTAPKAASDTELKTAVRAESSRTAEAHTSFVEQPWPTPPAMSLDERLKQLSESSADFLAKMTRLQDTQEQSRDRAREVEKKWLPVLEAENTRLREYKQQLDQRSAERTARFAQDRKLREQDRQVREQDRQARQQKQQVRQRKLEKLKAKQAELQAQSGKGKAKSSEETQVEHTSAPHAATPARPDVEQEVEQESQRPSGSASTQDEEDA